MGTKDDILTELKHKEKSVSDLIRFLNIRCDDTPNYSLLLGAGCSITSGIKSGGQLINEWKKEIAISNNIPEDSDEFDKFFESQDWYDDRNPYSSLFERRYDLQRQRRSFVENEVANKNPSIGYAYLVKLIEQNYFNAVFTTNFDDLLNEAFYRFSNVRPVVCAHDSAISSITITSKRPKIIKLHGDYLFEDIKSTLRETESLEGNMKNKFIEFSKDYGLIVVGYAGNDRSIMDILSYLLKKEEFFKNGIYWCIRKGDKNISDELKKLLWKDRVYFIQIDGFDEFMAELNKELNNGALPIDNALLSSEHQINLIKSLTSNDYVKKSASPIIQEDSKRLKKMVSHNFFEDFVKHFDFKKNKADETSYKSRLNELNQEEKNILNKIKISLMEDEIDKALGIIEELNIDKTENNIYKIELLEMKLSVIHIKGWENKDIYKETIDTLIELNPKKNVYYYDAVNSLNDIENKLSYIEKALTYYPCDDDLYRLKGNIMSDYYRSLLKKENSKISTDDITNAYMKSMELDGRISNISWVNLCKWYTYLYKTNTDKRKEKISELLEKYKPQNRYNPNYLEAAYSFKDYIDDDLDTLLSKGYSFAKESDNPSWTEKSLLLLIESLLDKSKDYEKIKREFDDFENLYNPSYTYLFEKARILSTRFGQIDEAINILKDIEYESLNKDRLLIRLYLIKDKYEDAKKIVDNRSSDINLLYNFYSEAGQYEKACEVIEEYWKNNSIEISDFVTYSFAMLKLKKYNDIYMQLKEYYAKPDTCLAEIAINYFIAEAHYNKTKPDERKIKNKILDKKELYDNDVIAAAYALINYKKEAFDYLRKAINENTLLKYSVREWPAFEQYFDDPQFKKIVGLTNDL